MNDVSLNQISQALEIAMPKWDSAKRPGNKYLEGQWCKVEPLELSLHGKPLFEALQINNEESSWKYLPYGSFADYAAFSKWIIETQMLKNEKLYAICDLTTNIAIGIAGYLNITPEHGVIEIGHLHYSPQLKQTPTATEAMYLMMQYAFEELGYRRYEWKCHYLNKASMQAAQRLGFTFEGIFRQHRVFKGHNRDTVWFSILDGEWPAIRHKLESWLAKDNFDGMGKQKKKLQDF